MFIGMAVSVAAVSGEGGPGEAPEEGFAILAEDGTAILAEDGTKILSEDAP